jgi:site-specific recombinase XerD
MVVFRLEYSPKTQKSYVDAVRNLAKYYMRSPDLLTEDDIRRFFLHIITVRKAAKSTVTIHLCGIKFFYEKTLGRKWFVFDMVRPSPTKKLPVVLSREEVRAILQRIRMPLVKLALTVIETFFGWWKRHLKVYHLIARSKYGLMVQLLGGLIT